MKKSKSSLPAAEKKGFRIGVRFSLEDLELLEERSTIPGLVNVVLHASANEKKGRAYKATVEFIRSAALGATLKRPVPELSRLGYIELQRIGNNINQLARAIHNTQSAQLPGLVNEVRDRLRNVSDWLVGIDQDRIDRHSGESAK